MNYNAAVNISATYDGQAVQRAKKDFDGFGGTIKTLRGALGAFGVALAVKELVQFGKSIIDLGDNMNDLRQKTGIGVQALSDLKAAAEQNGLEFGQFESALKKFSVTLGKAEGGSKEALSGFNALGISIKDANGHFKNTDELIFDIADAFAKAKDGPEKAAVAMSLFGKTGADLIPLLNGGRKAIQGLGVQMSDDFTKQADVFNDKLNVIGNSIKSFGVKIAEFALPYLNKFLDYVSRIRVSGLGITVDAEKKALSSRQPSAITGKIDTSKLMTSGDKSAAKEAETEALAVKKLIEQKYELAQMRGLEARSINLTKAEYDKQKIAIEESYKAEKELVGFKNKDQADAYRKAVQGIIEEKQALIDLQEQQKKSFGNGAKAAFREYSESIADLASQSKALFTNAFRGMEDALVEFVTKGKLDFSSLADSIIADLARIAVRQAVIAPIIGAVGGLFGAPTTALANGGIMTGAGPVPLRSYASGGVANRPQLALFGEGSRPEAYVPLPDGRNIPVKMEGGGGGVNVSVVVNMNGDGSSKTSSSGEAQNQQLGRMVSTAVVAELVKQKRPGGLLS